VLHFTNTPTSSQYKVYIKERPKKSARTVNSNIYDEVINEASRRFGISFSLLKAMIRAESAFNPKAVSRKGALGLMQIMPENLETLMVNDPFNPRQNIMGGTRYFKALLQRFNGKVPLALAAYNAGPTTVDQYRDIPPYPETEAYVQKVMKFYYTYKKS
jgi:soluble lytic murein transglycosylase